jgi:hypothetical protein
MLRPRQAALAPELPMAGFERSTLAELGSGRGSRSVI